jgi:hypothetical protein
MNSILFEGLTDVELGQSNKVKKRKRKKESETKIRLRLKKCFFVPMQFHFIAESVGFVVDCYRLHFCSARSPCTLIY